MIESPSPSVSNEKRIEGKGTRIFPLPWVLLIGLIGVFLAIAIPKIGKPIDYPGLNTEIMVGVVVLLLMAALTEIYNHYVVSLTLVTNANDFVNGMCLAHHNQHL